MSTPPRVWSRWTQEDESRLVELLERKKRIVEENRQPLIGLLVAAGYSESNVGALVDVLIARADTLVEMLTPFCLNEHVVKMQPVQPVLDRLAALGHSTFVPG